MRRGVLTLAVLVVLLQWTIGPGLAEASRPVKALAVLRSDAGSEYYISPRNSSYDLPRETGLLLRKLSHGTPADVVQSTVIGSRSGQHSGSWHLALDGETWRFVPDSPFAFGETVEVAVTLGEVAVEEQLAWSFQVRRHPDPLADPSRYAEFLQESQRPLGAPLSWKQLPADSAKILQIPYGLPSGLGEVSIYKGADATQMHLYTSLLHSDGKAGYPVHISSDGAIDLYRERIPYWQYAEPFDDIRRFIEFDNQHSFFVVYDTTYAPVDTIRIVNGIVRAHTDLHHLCFLENGNVLLLGLETHEENLSDSSWAGLEEASVVDMVVQELDADHELVFQWRSVDEPAFRLRDTVVPEKLTSSYVDYLHPNTVERDDDGNLLISLRNQSEVFKLDRTTGELIWRMGGANNEFEFIDEVRPFSAQHDVKRLPNGHLSLFDNGSYSDPRYARGVEYEVDEENMEATLVWSYDHNQEIESGSRGSMQRLPNGNTLLGWGGTYPTRIIATEVDSAGNIVMELYADNPVSTPDIHMVSYRVRYTSLTPRSPRPYLIAETTPEGKQRLLFASFGVPDVASYDVYVDDVSPPVNLLETVVGNSLLLDDSILPAGELLYAMARANFSDGSSSEVSNIEEFTPGVYSTPERETSLPNQWITLESWPNPFNETARIDLFTESRMDSRVTVTDILGREVVTLHEGVLGSGRHQWRFDGSGLASGVYFLRVRDGNSRSTTRRIVLLR